MNLQEAIQNVERAAIRTTLRIGKDPRATVERYVMLLNLLNVLQWIQRKKAH